MTLEALASGASTDPVIAKKIAAKASEMIEFLDMTRARAVGAAPYIHPRLASVAIKPDSRPRPETQQALKIVIDALDDMARRKLIELMPDCSSSS